MRAGLSHLPQHAPGPARILTARPATCHPARHARRLMQPSAVSLFPAWRAITDAVAESPLSAGELRAAAESHRELGPEYRDAVVESFVERIGKEIDARVDARPAQASAHPAPAPKQFNVQMMALGSIALGIPISGIAVAAGSHPAGIWGLLVVWIAIAAINIGYAMRLRPPTDRH
jgi:hypothetical protein